MFSMANEAVMITNMEENLHEVTVAAGTSISGMTLLQLTDPNTGSASSGADVFAGIAAVDKDGTDASTTLAVYRKGYFDLTNTGETISAGAKVSLSGANLIKEATEAEMITGAIVGTLMQDAAANEVVEVLVGAL